MKKLPKIILLLLFCFFIYLNTVYAKDNIENCFIEYNASEINNHDKSFNEILTKCYISDLSHLTGGSWSVVTNYSSHVRVNLNLEKLSFYNLNAVYKNIVGDTTTIMYSSPSSTNSYIYRIIYTFKADSSTSSGKCCRSLVNGKTNYTWDISNSSCNVVNGISDETTCVAKNNTNTTIKEDKEVCILTGKRYHWGKISSISAGSKEIEGLTKEDCRNKMKEQKAADTAEGNAKVEEAIKNTLANTQDTTINETGHNTNKMYVIKRVKTYNDTYNSKCTNCIRGVEKSNYFKSPVSNGDSKYDYYNVYKAYASNDGTTSNEEVSAFCIDPGMKGPDADGITYRASDSITYQNNPKFMNAIYRLYSYWYNDDNGRNEILNGFSGSEENKSDYIDYIVNNVARLTVSNYGGENIKFDLFPGSDSLKKEKGFYETNSFKDKAGLSNGGAAGQYSLATLKKVWEDVKQAAESGDVVPSTLDPNAIMVSKSDPWVMPIKSYVKLTGDFRSGSKTGYYCNNTPGGAFSESAFQKNESTGANTHNGIDFAETGVSQNEHEKLAVYAAQTGIVKAAGNISNNGSMGNAIVILVKFDDGTEVKTRYLHLDKIDKNILNKAKLADNDPNKVVRKGEYLGIAGNTDFSSEKRSSGIHLHFDVSSNDGSAVQKIGSKEYSARDYLPMQNIGICSQNSWSQDTPQVTTGQSSVSGSATTSKVYTSVKFKMSDSKSTITNNNNGFEAEFEIKLTSSGADADSRALDDITNDGKWNITVTTDKGAQIAKFNSNSSDIIVQKFDTQGTERSGKFKISLPSAFVGLASDIKKVQVNFNIEYQSKYALDNILVLTPINQSTTFQKFLTFLNGTVARTETLPIDVPGAESDECNPMFSLKCLPINSVSYLIEGTQSPEIFETVMDGINTVGDLVDFIDQATQILERLKNFNLNPNDILYIGSLAYNIADDLKIFVTIQTELAKLLDSDELKDNATAKRLKEALVRDVKVTESLKVVKTNGFACGLFNFSWCSKTIKETTSEEVVPDYSKDETKAFTDFVDLLIKAIDVNNESHQSVKDDWKQISEVSKSKLNSTVSNKTNNFITTINNFVTSAKSKTDLSNILNGLTKFGETLTDPSIFQEKLSLDNIANVAKNMSSAISGTLQTATSSVTDIVNQLKNMASKIDTSKMNLSDVSDIIGLLKNASTTDWEKCIIDNKDPNGNEYNVQSQNKYCTISCKEDYAFKTPGNLGTYYAGQNMTTNLDNVYQATIGIAGQRTCVTTSIDNDSYVSDAYELKEKTLEQYNLFMQTYAAQEKMLTTKLGTSKPAYSQGIQDTVTIEFNNIKDDIAANAEEQFGNAMDVFVKTLIGEDKPVSDRKALKATIMKESTGLINELAGKAFAKFKAGDGLLETDDIKNLFEQKLEGYKKGLEKNFPVAVNAAIESFKNGINVIIKNVGNSVGKDAIEAVGAVALSAACNAAPALQLIPYVGEAIYQGVKFVCDMYATISTTMADVIPKVSNATQGMIFGIYEPNSTSFQYEYSIYGFSNGNGANNCSTENVLDEGDEEYDVKALSANFACIRNTEGTQNQSSNNIFIPTLSKSGYVPGELHFGLSFDVIKLKRAIEQFSALTNELQKSKDALEGQLTVIGNTLEKFQKPSISSLASLLVGAVTGKLGNQLEDGFGSVFKVLQDYLVGESSYSMSILTNTIDTALNATLNLMGAFNPYYNDLANINNKLLGYKKTYNDYRDELTELATNMHDCTVWGNKFTFDPKLTFTYGYKFPGAGKSPTTESINLEKIDQNLEQDEIFYYCDSDVKLNDVQSINTILSKRCTTSDGILGAVLSALLKDTEFSKIADFIKDNAGIVKNLVKNEEVKSFLQKSGIYDSLCTIFGENGCPVEDGDDALTTGIPGELVYKLGENASFQNTFDSFKNISLDDVKSGAIVARLIGAVSSNFTYGPAKLEDVTYRNVGRVVRISRYGNPGVSISGIDMVRFLENMVTYIANYFGLQSNDVASRIYDAILSVTGEGAQKFIYFRSSKPYFTYSNKGIYTTNSNESKDTIPIDYGDTALFDDKIVSGVTGQDKVPTGKSYPIALTTKAGMYWYKITINNVGQYYNNNFSLGRIVDNNGYVNGTMENKFECYYKVETTPPQKECDPKKENCDACEQHIENAGDLCKKGGDNDTSKVFYRDLYIQSAKDIMGTDYQKKWDACASKLLENDNKTCCDYVKEASSGLSATTLETYNRVCKNPDNKPDCHGWDLLACIGNNNDICTRYGGNNQYSGYETGETGQTALINKDGSLQFYTKIVSNYNLFPNGDESKGDNWIGYTSGNEARDEQNKPVKQNINGIIGTIEGKGDTIYDEDPEYYIELDGACISKIKEYNRQLEISDLGFGDYGDGAENSATRAYKSAFLQALEEDPSYNSCAQSIKNNLILGKDN